ncbi:MAG: hypothetical protein RIQ94_3192 [Pseudomonadota bacterium]|jgi:Holliday junction resolvase-like predicted endonuclease
MEKHRGQMQEEYDLVMTNGNAIGIVEVKYKAHSNDLDKLDRKMKNFKKLFPISHLPELQTIWCYCFIPH